MVFRRSLLRVVSANSAGSVRDKNLFLSPAPLEAAEYTEGEHIGYGFRNQERGKKEKEKVFNELVRDGMLWRRR